MDSKKYIGMDVHQATISVAVRDSAGKLVMESILETKANTILEFIRGLGGSSWVTFEEGTSVWVREKAGQVEVHWGRVLLPPVRNQRLKGKVLLVETIPETKGRADGVRRLRRRRPPLPRALRRDVLRSARELWQSVSLRSVPEAPSLSIPCGIPAAFQNAPHGRTATPGGRH